MWNDVKDATNYVLGELGYSEYKKKYSGDIVKGIFNNNLPTAMKEAIFQERCKSLKCKFFNDCDTDTSFKDFEKMDDSLMTIMVGFEKLNKNGYIGE